MKKEDSELILKEEKRYKKPSLINLGKIKEETRGAEGPYADGATSVINFPNN